jgi:hypothetical protein
VHGDELTLRQPIRRVSLRQNGAIVIHQAATTLASRPGGFAAIIEEDLQATLQRTIRFAGWLLDHVDPVLRVTDVVPAAALPGAEYTAWMTRAEAASSGSRYQMEGTLNSPVVLLTPRRRPRQALIQQADVLAEDFVVLLRRQLKP